ncbi:MAG: VOC family protein [Chloroflexi bacterium]|nr:VOC family protein [Chloroflexota bacterium]
MLRGNGHVCIAVEDLEKELSFYRDVLGLQATLDYTAPDGTRMVLLAPPGPITPGGYALELLRFPQRRPLPEDHNAPAWLGFKHAAFLVDDLDELYQRLKARGVEVRGEPRSPQEGIPRVLNLLDPEGNRLELVEVGR